MSETLRWHQSNRIGGKNFSLISLKVAMYMYRLMHVFLSHGGEKETLVLLIAQKQSYQVQSPKLCILNPKSSNEKCAHQKHIVTCKLMWIIKFKKINNNIVYMFIMRILRVRPFAKYAERPENWHSFSTTKRNQPQKLETKKDFVPSSLTCITLISTLYMKVALGLARLSSSPGHPRQHTLSP